MRLSHVLKPDAVLKNAPHVNRVGSHNLDSIRQTIATVVIITSGTRKTNLLLYLTHLTGWSGVWRPAPLCHRMAGNRFQDLSDLCDRVRTSCNGSSN